jgi:hypothetical protein
MVGIVEGGQGSRGALKAWAVNGAQISNWVAGVTRPAPADAKISREVDKRGTREWDQFWERLN